MGKLEACKVLCKKDFDSKELAQFEQKIKEDYTVNFLIDNIPAARRFVVQNQDDLSAPKVAEDSSNLVYHKGFPLGIKYNDRVYINNHVRLVVYYHQDASYDGYRIVSFVVEAFSVKHDVLGEFKGEDTKFRTCDALHPVSSMSPRQDISPELTKQSIIFTYDVTWSQSEIKWASRWDLYLKMTNTEVHWFSICNSLVVVVFLSVALAIIMVRTLHRDLAAYNELYEDEEDEQEEKGWKLVHGDVFRPPAHAEYFAVLLGTGAQLIGMTVAMLIFACLGFLSPSNRGGLLSALLLLFVSMGIIAGYVSTRTYKMYGLTEWKTNVVRTAVFFPGVMFTGFFVLNLCVWSQGPI
jgi:transmembrane 9 superfamily protein 2/4